MTISGKHFLIIGTLLSLIVLYVLYDAGLFQRSSSQNQELAKCTAAFKGEFEFTQVTEEEAKTACQCSKETSGSYNDVYLWRCSETLVKRELYERVFRDRYELLSPDGISESEIKRTSKCDVEYTYELAVRDGVAGRIHLDVDEVWEGMQKCS